MMKVPGAIIKFSKIKKDSLKCISFGIQARIQQRGKKIKKHQVRLSKGIPKNASSILDLVTEVVIFFELWFFQ